MTPHAQRVARRLGLGLVVAIVLARCAPILYWADIQFDADQAVTGLMAKHTAEGRAFPVFQYAMRYVLVIEAWLSAPFVALADGSIPLVKAVPVLLNVATAAMVYLTAASSLAIGPIAALLVAAPVVLPAPSATQDLTNALGMNIEPLFFALLLWWLREKPVALGIVAAIAVKNREFAVYAVSALLIVDVLRDRSAALWRGRAVALVAFAVTWAAVEGLRAYSSPLGPGTTFAMMTGSGDNMAVATSSMCIEPALIPRDLWRTAMRFLPWQFGLTTDPRSVAAAYGVQPLTAAWLWLPLIGVLMAGTLAGIVRAWRSGPSSMTWFGLYLIGVGLQAVMVYGATRCGHVSAYTARYTLLSLLIPAGALALTLEREPSRVLRGVVAGVAMIWIAVCAAGHGSLVYALVQAQPRGAYKQLAEYLEARDVRFIVTDYWIGYNVAFLTGERVQALTDFERVHDYTLAVQANLDRAVEVRRVSGARCEGAAVVAGFYVCPPTSSRQP